MASLFISRSLAEDSPVRAWCTANEVSLVDQSLVHFSQPDRIVWPDEHFDWVFFYSPRGVEYFFDQYPHEWSDFQFACFGHGTAEALRAKDIHAAFVGNGEFRQVADDFAEVATGQSVLFPQARNSRRTVSRHIGDRILATEVVVYENEARPVEFEQSFKYLLFTSPMNVMAFLEKNFIDPFTHVLAIGATTEAALINRGIEEPLVAESPSEEALVEVLKTRTD
ncbi:MAG: uroporphyrinogen-III synthase [Bacteroidota bacterium]